MERLVGFFWGHACSKNKYIFLGSIWCAINSEKGGKISWKLDLEKAKKIRGVKSERLEGRMRQITYFLPRPLLRVCLDVQEGGKS